MTRALSLRTTASYAPEAGRPAPSTWAIGSGPKRDVSLACFARTVVSARRASDTRAVVVEPPFGRGEVVGHVLRSDVRPIPRPGSGMAVVDLVAFRLTTALPPGHLVLGRAAAMRLLRRRLPAMIGALCLPMAMVPMPALASGSGRARTRSTASPAEDETAQDAEADRLPDSAWQSMVGSTVALERPAGEDVVGELAAVDEDNATIVADDGSLTVVPRADVSGVRRIEAPPPPAAAQPTTTPAPVATQPATDGGGDEYKGLIIGGSIMVGAGATLAIAGMALTGYYVAYDCAAPNSFSSSPTCSLIERPELWAGTVLVPGLLLVAGGGAMLGVGIKRKKDADVRKRKAEVRLIPRVQRNAWGGGLQLRF